MSRRPRRRTGRPRSARLGRAAGGRRRGHRPGRHQLSQWQPAGCGRPCSRTRQEPSRGLPCRPSAVQFITGPESAPGGAASQSRPRPACWCLRRGGHRHRRLVGAGVRGVASASSHGWASVTTALLLAAAAVLIGMFVVIEARSAAPLLTLSFFANRTVTAATAASLLLPSLLPPACPETVRSCGLDAWKRALPSRYSPTCSAGRPATLSWNSAERSGSVTGNTAIARQRAETGRLAGPCRTSPSR